MPGDLTLSPANRKSGNLSTRRGPISGHSAEQGWLLAVEESVMTVSMSRRRGNAMIRLAALAYGLSAFLLTFAFFTHLVVFLGNFPEPSDPWLRPTVDVGGSMGVVPASLIDLALVLLFGLQHSLMARPAFKRWLTRAIPEGLERATYVLASCAAGFVMLLLWQPIPVILWTIAEPLSSIVWALFALGWAILLIAAINLGLFELLGLRQIWAWMHGQPAPEPSLKTGGLYRLLRHPMYVGVLLGLWMTPVMTAGHLLLAGALTSYILIARNFEERDLKRTFGTAYAHPAARPRS